MADEGGEKTEEPTHKKLEDAKRKGQVWKSKDFTGSLVFIVGLSVVKGIWGNFESELTHLFQYGFDKLSNPHDLYRSLTVILYMGLLSMAFVVPPVVFACAIVGALADFLQTGGVFSVEAMMPKLDKLNPIQGLKNMFAKKQLVELIKSMSKVFITAYVVYGVVRDALGMVVGTIRGNEKQTMLVLGELVFRISARVALLFVMFAVFDLWWQRRAFMKDMMMTKDEVKREYKESEGDPHHKAKRKQLHHEILESAQMEAVKGADVVVTNPDHVAVALKYDREKDPAPRVIAKGIDARAEAIKALARDGDVALLRNVPLAHALLRIEVGEEIPEQLYDAVAEVLNFVYQLKQQAAAGLSA